MKQVKATYAVLRSGGYWRLLAPGEAHRTFDYRIDAEEAAVKLADKARQQGLETEILLQDPFGEMQPLRFG